MDKLSNQENKPDFEPIKSNLFLNSNNLNNDNSNFDELLMFKPFLCGNTSFKNHFVFINLNDNEFYEDYSKFINYYRTIAKSGVGLIITGCFEFDYILKNKNLQNLTKEYLNEIHSFGTKIYFQIKPNFSRGNKLKSINKFNYSASFNYSYGGAEKFCLRFSDSKCNKLICDIEDLCNYAGQVGFDGIMLSGDLFNILGEFSSCEFNHRYFGYYAGNDELALKIIQSINKPNLNIIYSFTIDSFLKNIYENQLKNIKTTSKIDSKTSFDNVIEFLVKLVNFGVTGFIFRFGTYENEYLNVYNELEGEYLFYDFYKYINNYFKTNNIKNKFNEDVQIIYSDNINNISKCDLYLKNELFDFVDVTKQILADNNYLKNLQNNQESLPCIKCSYCNKYAEDFNKISCLVNPDIYGLNLQKINILKNNRVAVVGAGVSGIMCACFLSDRGYLVDLFEKNETINEKGRSLEIFGMCKLTKKFNDYIENLLTKNAKNGQISLKTASKLENIEKFDNYRAVIIATGFKEKFLKITGSVLKTVISIYDFLSNKKCLNKDKFIIFAKSELSLKLAIYLLTSKKKVAVIIQDFDAIKNLPNDKFSYYFYLLSKYNAEVYLNANIKIIEFDFVEVIANKFTKNKLLTYIMNLKSNVKSKLEKKLFLVDYDLFVYEPEIIENNKLYYDIVASGYKGEVYMIGNALQICDDAECIKSAYYVAKNL